MRESLFQPAFFPRPVVLFFVTSSGVFAQDKTLSGTLPKETIDDGNLPSILVFDVPELTREVRVDQSGTISVPLSSLYGPRREFCSRWGLVLRRLLSLQHRCGRRERE